jgi:hypothetical protein
VTIVSERNVSFHRYEVRSPVVGSQSVLWICQGGISEWHPAVLRFADSYYM